VASRPARCLVNVCFCLYHVLGLVVCASMISSANKKLPSEFTCHLRRNNKLDMVLIFQHAAFFSAFSDELLTACRRCQRQSLLDWHLMIGVCCWRILASIFTSGDHAVMRHSNE